jgi:hypothetical protein
MRMRYWWYYGNELSRHLINSQLLKAGQCRRRLKKGNLAINEKCYKRPMVRILEQKKQQILS